MSNPLNNLKIDYWYKAILVIATTLLIVSLSVKMIGVPNTFVQLMSLGAIFIGIGEWINHPLQQILAPGAKMTGYPRSNSILGTLFDFIGIIIIGNSLFCFFVN